MKKLVSIVLALALVLASCAVAFADDAAPKGKIVISNAAKGITYEIYKLFDATTDGNGAIAYTGTIPSTLTDYFQYVENTSDQYIEAKVSGEELSKTAAADLKDWAENNSSAKVSTAAGTGSSVSFENLPYGYYVITSTQGEGKVTVVTLASDEKDIVDKNTTDVTVGKEVDDKDVHIGEKVTYTLTVNTSNYMGEGENAKQVVKYVIKDTLPNYLSNPTIKSVTIGSESVSPVPQFNNKQIEIEWASGSHADGYTSLYNNGTVITVVYEASVNENVNVGDADGNRNVLEVIPYVDDGETPGPWDEHFYADEIIKTYGAAIHKVDEEGNSLTGAKFAIKGLTVSGEAGKYTVVNYDASSDTYSDDMDVDSEGYLYILGLPSDITLTAKETKAPDGYNLVTTEITNMKTIKMSETVSYTSKDVYYDAEGKVIHEESASGTKKNITALDDELKDEANVLTVENKKGTELPHTGGIGTTIFYILGGLLVIGAAVILVARRKAQD